MKTPPGKTLLQYGFWAIVLLLLINAGDIVEALRAPVQYNAAQAGEVTLYSTQSCGYCRKARHFLATHDVPYQERDIEQSESARRAFTRLGGRGVPLITIGTQVLHGYDRSGLRAALACADCAPP